MLALLLGPSLHFTPSAYGNSAHAVCMSGHTTRRDAVQMAGGGNAAAWLFGAKKANAAQTGGGKSGPTNQVLSTVNGVRQRRLGGGEIVVSEMGLGTQRWGSMDFNGPDEKLCHAM